MRCGGPWNILLSNHIREEKVQSTCGNHRTSELPQRPCNPPIPSRSQEGTWVASSLKPPFYALRLLWSLMAL
eukprot:1087584-Amphidinium_carterae.1